MASQRQKVCDQAVELGIADMLSRKGRHGPEASSYLVFHEKSGKRFIVERRPESGLSSRMALMAVPHEDLLTHGDLG
jgi:hypothetical protein